MGGVAFGAPAPLSPEDDLAAFSCGLELVDSWVHKWARKAEATNTARIYVAHAGSEVAGLYSLSTHAIARERGIAGTLRRNAPDPIPCTLLGMLGVDSRFQGLGLGWSLLRDAILRAKQASLVVASRALVVEPAGSELVAFYKRYGFSELDAEGRLFLRL